MVNVNYYTKKYHQSTLGAVEDDGDKFYSLCSEVRQTSLSIRSILFNKVLSRTNRVARESTLKTDPGVESCRCFTAQNLSRRTINSNVRVALRKSLMDACYKQNLLTAIHQMRSCRLTEDEKEKTRGRRNFILVHLN